MVKRVTVLLNLFRRKSGVHPVMPPRQFVFRKKFKTPLCKIGELVMAYNVTFFTLYVGPIDSSSGHTVFKLSTEKLVITPKCQPKLMAEDIVTYWRGGRNARRNTIPLYISQINALRLIR